ncbi:MAG: hypothetical protein FWC11_05900 [Firmicutes bacterium]|nr:hypothetical protein [Bacillota bacterium]
MELIRRDISIKIKPIVAKPLIALRQFFNSRKALDIFDKLINVLKNSIVELAQTAHSQKQLNLLKISKCYPNQEYCVEYPFYIFYEMNDDTCFVELILHSSQDIDRILAKKRDAYIVVKNDEDIQQKAVEKICLIEKELKTSKESVAVSFEEFFNKIVNGKKFE